MYKHGDIDGDVDRIFQYCCNVGTFCMNNNILYHMDQDFFRGRDPQKTLNISGEETIVNIGFILFK